MEVLSLIGSICSIASLLIAIFLVDKVVRINNKVNLINTKNTVRETHGDDRSQNIKMKEVEAEDIVFGNMNKGVNKDVDKLK